MEAGKHVKDGGQKVVQLFQKKKSRTNKKATVRSALHCPECGSDDVLASLTTLARIKSIRDRGDRFITEQSIYMGAEYIQFLLCRNCGFVGRHVEYWMGE